MATLVENAAAVKSKAAEIDAAIVAKGGSTEGGLSNAAAAIAALPSGEWQPPSTWPNIRAILAADTGVEGHPEYANKIIMLLVPRDEGVYLNLTGGKAYKCHDADGDHVYTGTSVMTWTPNRTELNYVIAYSDTVFTAIPYFSNAGVTNIDTAYWIAGNGCSVNFSNPYANQGGNINNFSSLQLIENLNVTSTSGDDYYGLFGGVGVLSFRDVNVTIKNTAGRFLLGYTYGLKELPHIAFDDSVTGMNRLMSDCYAVIDLNDVDMKSPTDFTNAFYGARNLKRLPKYLDLSRAAGWSFTRASSGLKWQGMTEIPYAIIPNLASSTGISVNFACSCVDPDSVAKFDANGNIVDGFAAFAAVPSGWKCAGKTSDATGAAATHAMTLSNTVKWQFTSAQQAAIGTAFSDHGWTLSWAN